MSTKRVHIDIETVAREVERPRMPLELTDPVTLVTGPGIEPFVAHTRQERAGMTALAGLAMLAVTGSEVLLSHEAMMKSAALTPKERRERAERNKKKHPGRHGKSKRR